MCLFSENISTPQAYFIKPPLPFIGNKRNARTLLDSFIKEFRHTNKIPKKDLIIVDVFGGSGFVAHTFKYILPSAHVIWNDFDNYRQRLDNIPTTNQISKEINQFLVSEKVNEKVNEKVKSEIIEIIRSYKERGDFIDYITLSSMLCFSGEIRKDFESLASSSFYKRNYKKTYCADGYLAGVERVRVDYKEIIAKYAQNPNALLILDPPYLQTETKQYNMRYWKMADYLHLLTLVRKPYIFFSSEKSDILDLMNFLDNYTDAFKQRKVKQYYLNRINGGLRTKKNYDIFDEKNYKEMQKNIDFLIYDF